MSLVHIWGKFINNVLTEMQFEIYVKCFRSVLEKYTSHTAFELEAVNCQLFVLC